MRRALLSMSASATAVAAATALTVFVGNPGPAEPVVNSATDHPAPTGERLPADFTERRLKVGDVNINFVEGGRGKTLVLLHGYPQTWHEWRAQLPELAKHYRVIAPDLRGAGRSDAPATGYDKKTLAADIHGLLTRLGRDKDVRIVGHDIGTMVAYAYAAAHPRDVRKLVLSEAPIPDKSLYRFPSLTSQGPGFWNFGFFSVENGLPEQAVDGRETQWVEGFTDLLEYNKAGITHEDATLYGNYLKDDAHLRASFEWFRTLDQDVADNRINGRTKLTMPVLAIGASHSLGEAVPDQVRKYATHVTEKVIENSGHWIYEERPTELTDVLLTFLAD
ncbi:alpha/beta hydrolase [Streptomyces sp. ME02-8801-2C]|uniref:alpha/beta fold hydrolase n=1 Tax=Streptomyces sp. ME02-8801-2C TaxID=3028680 RepID=UPI0029BA6A60|nr:alpha/beta hydrolase [Streptomyces sp. ME02-8801-2C]MDX3458332.1 alpha/beta hydrolase [Streptomyces sp. ME02-8801-2C]